MTATAGRGEDAARFERILDATRDPVFLIDPATLRLDYANRGLGDQLGVDPSALLDTSPTAFVADLDEDRLRRIATDVLGGRGPHTASLAFRRPDGTALPVDVLFQGIDVGDGERRIVATARDISDRVGAQARLQRLAETEHARAAELNAVIEALGDGVLVCGPNGRIRLANPAARDLVPGIHSYDELLALFEDPLRRAPDRGQRAGPVDLRLAGSADRWLELSTFPVPPTAAGREARGETIVLLRDVTLARRAQASRETFVHMLSHELRTPVTTIYGGAQVLYRRGDALDDATRLSLLADIHGEAERLHRLVEDIIALARFGEDEARVGVEPVLVQRIVPAVVASEQSRWPGMEITVRLPADLPTVMADRTYVEQVVRNLLSNAAKYAGPEVAVELIAAAEGEEVVVRVLDRGPGFAADEASRLFDLYYRSADTAAFAGGAGIGLFVCARLIEAMGGRIWALPRAGGGAEFGFSLEVMRDEE